MAQKASPSFQAVDMLVTLTPGYLVGKYKNLVGKYENILWENIKTWSANIINILWAKLSNIKHVVAGV